MTSQKKVVPSPLESCKVYTPAPLAQAMVRALGAGLDATWLEPCAGKGVFVRAISNLGVRPKQIVAIDLDNKTHGLGRIAKFHPGTEFFSWAKSTRRRFDYVVGNPPYVALNKLDPLIQREALLVRAPTGESVSLRSNCWYAFVCASISLLRPGGGIGFVLPAAWDYAEYAKPLRESLVDMFRCLEVHRSSRPLFESVQEGSIVVLARGFGEGPGEHVRYEHSDREALIRRLRSGRLRSGGRSLPSTTHPTVVLGNLRRQNGTQSNLRRLGDLVEVRLGGVTGDVGFFLLTEQDRVSRGLPVRSLRPVISKARHLVSSEISKKEWSRLRNAGERVWLFSPGGRALNHPAVRAYLSLPPSKGGCRKRRFKVQNRKPWFRTPLPGKCDGFLSGMSPSGPWICLQAMSRLSATNTLYVVRFKGGISGGMRFAVALSLLSSQSRDALKGVERLYPDGLRKFEPGDIGDLMVEMPKSAAGSRAAYRCAVKALIGGDSQQAQRIADRWLSKARRA